MDVPPIQYASSSDGVNVAYWVTGRGPPVVALHELGSSHIQMEWDLPLAKTAYQRMAAEYSLVRLDHRNTGLSTRGVLAAGVDELVQDLEAVIDQLPNDKVTLIGNQLQTKVVVKYAATHPGKVHAIILSQVALKLADTSPINDVLRAIFPLTKTDWLKFTELCCVMINGLEHPGVDTHQLVNMFRAAIDADDLRHCLEAISTTDVSELLPQVAAPVLLLHGSGEVVSLIAAQDAAARLPRASLVPVKSKLLYWYEEEAVDAILRFLREITEEATLAKGTAASSAFRTILFTDVVASTPLLAQLKDEKMRAIMRDHDEVLEAAVTDNGGRVIKTIGDAFMAEFAIPSGAVEAAIAAQRGIRDKFADSDVPFRLRIGINAGEPIEEDVDLHGASVVIAKRLESESENGGILVSEVVRQAVAGKEFEFTDRGEVSLKGFDEPVRAWSLEW